jgi:hypothetical protein
MPASPGCSADTSARCPRSVAQARWTGSAESGPPCTRCSVVSVVPSCLSAVCHPRNAPRRRPDSSVTRTVTSQTSRRHNLISFQICVKSKNGPFPLSYKTGCVLISWFSTDLSLWFIITVMMDTVHCLLPTRSIWNRGLLYRIYFRIDRKNRNRTKI